MQMELKHLWSLTVDVSDLSKDHKLQAAPLITREAYITAGYKKHSTPYGVMGQVLSIYSKLSAYAPVDPRLYVNTVNLQNMPFTIVVCGVQGSGKSHTVLVLLKNMLISKLQEIGSLEQSLVGLVLHFGEGGGVRMPKVQVFVSKSLLNTIKSVYAPLGKNVEVVPLSFNETELDAQAFLSMMAVRSSDSTPLYIQIILKRLFNPTQVAGLEQCLALLNSFMVSNVLAPKSTPCHFAVGQLTIVDLSDPFIDTGSVCGLFEIITRLFVLVVNEAHKYLSTNRGVSGLTKAILTLTREQRHLGMRVIISTQGNSNSWLDEG
ncbi:hypothetical protein BDR06DRAFT_982601 [Suillus hirtellus]|nr:hypothetical protein BDR06DRAFT_982601 [Suillus hirtellus]